MMQKAANLPHGICRYSDDTDQKVLKDGFCSAVQNVLNILYEQQCGILTSVDSDEPVQPPFKLINTK